MNKWFNTIVLSTVAFSFVLIPSIFSEDKAAYTVNEATKVRQVSDYVAFLSGTVGTTNETINLQRTACRVTIRNLSAANDLYVNFSGSTAFSIAGTTGIVVAAQNRLSDTAHNFTTEGVQAGDVVALTEGDTNDGFYYITRVDGSNLYLNPAPAANTASDANYTLKTFGINCADATDYVFEVGTQSIGIVGTAAGTNFQLIIEYQKGS